MEMNKVVDEYKEKYNLNYSVLATPAEGLSGRFTKMDRRKYGKIPGVTDRDYYVNSFHVDVKEPISIVEKIKRELGKKLTMYKIPDLTFIKDESIEYGNKIDEMLRNLERKD